MGPGRGGRGCAVSWGPPWFPPPASSPRVVSWGGDAAESSTHPAGSLRVQGEAAHLLTQARGSLASPPVITAPVPSTLLFPPRLQNPGLKLPIPQGGAQSAPGPSLVGCPVPPTWPVLSKEGSVLPGPRPQRLALQVAHMSVCLCVSVCMSPSLLRAHHTPSSFYLISASF